MCRIRVFSERDGSFLAKDSESPTSITTGGAAVDPFGVCGEVLNVFNSLTEPSLSSTLPKTLLIIVIVLEEC